MRDDFSPMLTSSSCREARGWGSLSASPSAEFLLLPFLSAETDKIGESSVTSAMPDKAVHPLALFAELLPGGDGELFFLQDGIKAQQ